jgi:hypothetical protein
MSRVWLDLLAQLIHEDAQVLHLISVIRTPDRLQELGLRERPTRISNQLLQQFELFWR